MAHFAKHTNASIQNPALLILDNHESHISLKIFEFCRQHGITLLSLPSHCSHKMQPLSFFKPLKTAYYRECDYFMTTNAGRRITQYDVVGLFSSAYRRVANLEKAENGFKSAGIFPINPDIFTDEDFYASDQLRPIIHIVDLTPNTELVNSEEIEHESGGEPVVEEMICEHEPAILSPTDIMPLPKHVASSNSKKRKKMTSCILTGSPMKEILLEKDNKASLIKSKGRNTINKSKKGKPKLISFNILPYSKNVS